MLSKRFRKTKIAVIGLALTLLALSVWLQPPRAAYETIFYGGTILTMNPDAPEAEALLMRGEKILAVGTLEQVRAAAFTDATEFDLEGQTLMPGFIEPHTHPLATAMFGETIDVSGFSYSNREDIIKALKTGIAEIGSGRWAVAYGWDPVMLPDLDPPTLAELDALSPDQPLVILTQMMHDAYANSAALAAANITAATPNPPGAEFVRDKNGNLTGTVREVAAITHLFDAAPALPDSIAPFLLARQYAAYAKAGYTTIGILGPVGRTSDPIGAMQYIAAQQTVPVRSYIYALPHQLDTGSSGGIKSLDPPHIPGAVVGVKFWMDGSPFAGGAAFDEPYEDSDLVTHRLHLQAGHIGPMNYSPEEFENAFRRYHKLGYQIAVHAQGERAIYRVLTIAEKILSETPRPGHRHRLEHNALITRQQLSQAQTLGMTTSFFADHISFYGHALPDLVGPERTERYMPIKWALEAGHKATVHTDNPATPIGPFRAMQTLRARQALASGAIIGADQRLAPHEALEAMTINAAWQLGIDGQTGSLEAGKLADLVLLSKNPMTTPDSELQTIEVICTWLAGQPADVRELTPITLKTGFRLLLDMVFG